jgi:pyridoxal 5'-phosphate synthase pdxT subunit
VTLVIGVLALQGDAAEHLRALAAAGVQAVPVRRPSELNAVDGLAIPGGKSTMMRMLSAAFDLTGPLRKADRRRHAGVRPLCRDDHAGERAARRGAACSAA